MSELGSGSGSSYPGSLDTDSTLEVNSPNAGKTKARAEVPNDLASAIIATQTELGTDPAGSLTDVKTWLQTEHGVDGTHTNFVDDVVMHGFEIIGAATGANFTVGAGKLMHGSVRISKTADITLTFATAGDWWDGATDDYTGGADWCYIGVNSSGSVKLLGANPPDKTDVSGNSAGDLLYWYDSSLYWRVIGAVFVNTSNQVSFALNGVGRSVAILANEVLSAGTQTGSYASIDISTVVPIGAKKVYGYYKSSTETGNAGTRIASTSAALNKIVILTYVNAGSVRTPFEIMLVEAQTIYYEKIAGTSVDLLISGWSFI